MKSGRTTAWISGIFIGLIALFFLWLPPAAFPSPIHAFLLHVPFGWWEFLRRNLSQITCSPGLIATGIISSALALLLGHWLLRSLARQTQQARDATAPVRPWPWRWSACIYVGLWLLFAIAFGAAGVARHTSWLLNDPEPWYQARVEAVNEMRMVDGVIAQVSLEHDGDIDAVRKALAGERLYRWESKLLRDNFDVILYGDVSNRVAAYLIIPRSPQMVAKKVFGAWNNGPNDLLTPITELSNTIARLDAMYPPRPAR